MTGYYTPAKRPQLVNDILHKQIRSGIALLRALNVRCQEHVQSSVLKVRSLGHRYLHWNRDDKIQKRISVVRDVIEHFAKLLVGAAWWQATGFLDVADGVFDHVGEVQLQGPWARDSSRSWVGVRWRVGLLNVA